MGDMSAKPTPSQAKPSQAKPSQAQAEAEAEAEAEKPSQAAEPVVQGFWIYCRIQGLDVYGVGCRVEGLGR